MSSDEVPPFLRVRGLTKRLGGHEVLRGVDLEVAAGQTLVIIGRSGGGKSVFLKHLIGLLQPDAGEIVVEGENIVGLSERRLAPVRRKVGILFQHGALFDSLTVADNVAFPLRESGERHPATVAAAVREALEVVNLDGQQDKMPVDLSGGMRKRVALARAVITRPRCILYDEPTAGLDPVVSDSIDRLIRRLQRRFGVTSVVVTHDMKSAFAIADRIAYLKTGRINPMRCLSITLLPPPERPMTTRVSPAATVRSPPRRISCAPMVLVSPRTDSIGILDFGFWILDCCSSVGSATVGGGMG